MTTTTSATHTIAVVGNPNTGKTLLFNALTGYERHVANYPGVTVETARGRVRGGTAALELLDLPGTYSLSPASPDEAVVTDALCGSGAARDPISAVLVVADASNLNRNFFLLSHLVELGLPVVVALNMMDIAKERGLEIDCDQLSQRLGVTVVPVIATQRHTVLPLIAALDAAVVAQNPPTNQPVLPAELEREAAQFAREAEFELTPQFARRVLVDRKAYAEEDYLKRGGSSERLASARARLETVGITNPVQEVRARYAWVNDLLADVVRRPEKRIETLSERIDRVLTHKVGGGLILVFVMAVLFQSIFTWAGPLMDLIEGAFGALAGLVAPLLPEGAVRSLITDGIIGGVGGVLVFLPQILILFAFIAVLEDCGYMARAAYMNDKLMRALGLSGRSFIPLLSGFACAIPAIMGTRAIADRRERFVTILVIPLMSCSARLPVYVLLIGAFVAPTPVFAFLGGWFTWQGATMLGVYFVGIIAAIGVSLVLRRTVFKGETPTFMIELPAYKLPRARAIWQRMRHAGREFVVRAGTVILLVNLAVWALAYFPRSEATVQPIQAQALAEDWPAERLEQEIEGAHLRNSFLGRFGQAFEPIVRPLGWDWRLGTAVLASFPAREVVIAALGTLFNLGPDIDEESETLRETLHSARAPDGAALFNVPVALSVMVFFALCMQCSATLVIMARELGSWNWPIAVFFIYTALAYVCALFTYHGSAWLLGDA